MTMKPFTERQFANVVAYMLEQMTGDLVRVVTANQRGPNKGWRVQRWTGAVWVSA
jgi:hypothetical protein